MTQLQPIDINFNTFDPAAFVNPIFSAINKVVPQLPSLIIGIILAVLFIRIITRVTRFALTFTTFSAALSNIITAALSAALWVIVVMQLLQLLGFGGVVIFFSTSVAAIGLVMAAGGSTLFSDVAAGTYLAENRNFGVGDEIIVGELYGAPLCQGVIESLDLRRAGIRDKDGLMHFLPNSLLERRDIVVVHSVDEPTVYGKAAKKLRAAASKRRPKITDKSQTDSWRRF